MQLPSMAGPAVWVSWVPPQCCATATAVFLLHGVSESAVLTHSPLACMLSRERLLVWCRLSQCRLCDVSYLHYQAYMHNYGEQPLFSVLCPCLCLDARTSM